MCLLFSEQKQGTLLNWRLSILLLLNERREQQKHAYKKEQTGFVMFIKPKARKLDKRKLSGLYSYED